MSFCGTYCSHGGVCDIDAPHPGQPHSASGYCTWNDDESIDKEEADDLFRLRGAEIGLDVPIVERIIDGT